MRVGIIIAAGVAILATSSGRAPAQPVLFDETYFLGVSPYQGAARCLGIITVDDRLVFNGEQELLEQVIAADPNLDADVQRHNGGAFYIRNLRYKLIDLVLQNENEAILDWKGGHIPEAVAQSSCYLVARESTQPSVTEKMVRP